MLVTRYALSGLDIDGSHDLFKMLDTFDGLEVLYNVKVLDGLEVFDNFDALVLIYWSQVLVIWYLSQGVYLEIFKSKSITNFF